MSAPDIYEGAEIYVSVDVETSGPVPGDFSLLQIGACIVGSEADAFECLVKPISNNVIPEAMAVTGLELTRLYEIGLAPEKAMIDFNAWLEVSVKPKGNPVFVGFNASFDWSFVNYYFHHFLGFNPFGINAIDIKSLYMGSEKCLWRETRSDSIAMAFDISGRGDHDALNDARFQAALFRHIRNGRG